MDLTALFVFALALFVAAASPGPAITALVARVLVRGTVGALAYMLGLAVGDIFWLTCAVSAWLSSPRRSPGSSSC